MIEGAMTQRLDQLDRRAFLRGLMVTAAGVLVPKPAQVFVPSPKVLASIQTTIVAAIERAMTPFTDATKLTRAEVDAMVQALKSSSLRNGHGYIILPPGAFAECLDLSPEARADYEALPPVRWYDEAQPHSLNDLLEAPKRLAQAPYPTHTDGYYEGFEPPFDSSAFGSSAGYGNRDPLNHHSWQAEDDESGELGRLTATLIR